MDSLRLEFYRMLGLEEVQSLDYFRLYFRRDWPGYVPVLLLAAVIAFGFAVYRRENAVGHAARMLLAAIRAALLAFLIVLLLQPVLALDLTAKLRGCILVLVDVSSSMGIKDPRPGKSDLEEAALALGLLPYGGPAADLEGAAKTRAATATRMEIATRILRHPEVPWVEQLREDNKIRFFGFSDQLVPASGEGETTGHVLAGAKPVGAATALGAAIDGAVARYSGQPITGVIILTDGASNQGVDPIEVARRMRDRRIPIVPIGIGTPNPPDVRMLDLAVQETVFSSDTVPVRVQIQSTGFRGRAAELKVLLDGTEVAGKKIILSGLPQFEEVAFVPEGRSGTIALEAGVTPLDGEVAKENNTRSQPVRVIDEKIKVLYVEGAPRWEYRYLRAVLLRDPRLDVKFLMSEGDPALARYSPHHLDRFPDEAGEAFKFDLVIIGDVRAAFFTPAQLARIEQLVKERGGSLLMLAGPTYAPATYNGTPLEQMLPVKLGSGENELVPDDVCPVITLAGMQGAAVVFEASKPANDALWSQVKPLHEVPRLNGAKPGATVLATLSDGARRSEAYPLIAWQRYGSGKCMFVGSDELWRLRFKTGDTYHAAFWGQTIRFLTLSRLLGGNKRIHLQTDRPSYQTHERVQIYANVLNDAFEPVRAPDYTVFVGREGAADQPTPVRLDPVPDSPGFFQGGFVPERDGRHVLEPDPTEAPLANKAEFQVATLPLEQREPAMQESLLREMAGASGGQYFSVRDLPGLGRFFRRETQTTSVRLEKELWDLPAMFVIAIALAGIEWSVRRRCDLP